MSVNSVDFEPSLIADRTYTSRQLPTKVDVAATLSFMVGLLYIIPGQAIVPNLTGAGRPALLVALLLWCWWLMVRLNPWLTMVGSRVIARRTSRTSVLIAGRRMSENPRGAFRAISGLILALFVGSVSVGIK